MRSPLATRCRGVLSDAVCGRCGAGGRLLVSWAMAGGITGGGLLLGALAVVGWIEPGLYVLAAPVGFVLGSALGAAHAVVLAWAVRPRGSGIAPFARRSLVASALAIPGLGCAWVTTAGITITAAVLLEVRASWLLLAAGSWIAGASLCAWAAAEGLEAARVVTARWPRVRLGLLALPPVGVAAALWFAWAPRPLPGTALRPAWPLAIGLALAVTIWVALPILLLGLHALPGGLAEGRREGEAASP